LFLIVFSVFPSGLALLIFQSFTVLHSNSGLSADQNTLLHKNDYPILRSGHFEPLTDSVTKERTLATKFYFSGVGQPLQDSVGRTTRILAMFFLKEETKVISLHPSYFGPNVREYLINRLNEEEEGRCTGDHFVICVMDMVDIGEGRVLPSNGQAEYTIKYRAIIWKPFRGETVSFLLIRLLVVSNPYLRWTPLSHP
jgi:hypothetical protein